jgi:hypothetical protein
MADPSFAIDTLNLHVPHGFASRADRIARQIGNELARLPIYHDVEVPLLQLPAITVHGGENNSVIARRIAQAIHRQVINTSLTQGQIHGAD